MQSQLEPMVDIVENELRWRLSDKPCPTCKRGAEAHKMAATSLSQLAIGYERMEIARAREGQDGEKETFDLNPLSLVATVKKLPVDHPKRAELLELLEGHVIALQEAIRSLHGEEEA